MFLPAGASLAWAGAGIGGAVVGLLLTPVTLRQLRAARPRASVAVVTGTTVAALFLLVVLRVEVGIALVPYLFLAAIGGMLATIDVLERRLPNRLVLLATVGFAVLLVGLEIVQRTPGALAGAALGGIALLAVYVALALVPGARIGGGDVKLAFVLGSAAGSVGLRPWLLCLVGAFLLNAIVALTLLALRRVRLTSAVPLGPWMIAAAFLGIALG